MIKNVCLIFLLAALTAGSAFGQSANATCSLTNQNQVFSGTCTIVLGSAKLTYHYHDQTNATCTSRQGRIFTFDVIQLSNFIYTDPAGNTSVPFNTFTKRTVPQGVQGCPTPLSFPSSVEIAPTASIADFGSALTFFPATTTAAHASISALDTGSLGPKYEVLAVVYAPPGAASNVVYGTSTMMGVTNSFANTFTNASTESDSITLKDTAIPGIMGSSVSETLSTGFTQSSSGSGSLAINKSSSITNTISGPLNSLAGIDHDYDQIFIWLNPVLEIEHFNNNVILGQGGFDPRDPTGEIDQIPLFVIDLKNLIAGTFTGDPDIPARLARTWAGSGQGLTTADLQTILARDPFANGSTTIDPTRFTLTGQNFNYLPPPSGGQPDKSTLTLSYIATTTQGQTVTDSYSVGVTTDVSETFLSFLTSDMKTSDTLTWTSTFTLQTTQASGQTATFNLTGPPSGYTGPTDLVVYQDNIYGTFMFNLIP